MEESIANNERPTRTSSHYACPQRGYFAPSMDDSDISNMCSVSVKVVVKPLAPQREGSVKYLVMQENDEQLKNEDADGKSDTLSPNHRSARNVVNDDDKEDGVAALGFYSGSRGSTNSKTIREKSNSSSIGPTQNSANQNHVDNGDNVDKDADVKKPQPHPILDMERNRPSGQSLLLNDYPCQQNETTQTLERAENCPHIGPVLEGKNGEGALKFDSGQDDGGLATDTSKHSAPSSLDCFANNDRIDKEFRENHSRSCRAVDLPTLSGSSISPGIDLSRFDPLCEKASTDGSTSTSRLDTSHDMGIFSVAGTERKEVVENSTAIGTKIGMDDVPDRRVEVAGSEVLKPSFGPQQDTFEFSSSPKQDISSFPREGQCSSMTNPKHQPASPRIVMVDEEESTIEDGRDDRTTIITGNSCEIEVTVKYHGQPNRKKARYFHEEQRREQPTAISKSQRNYPVTTNGRRRGEPGPELEPSIRKRSFGPKDHFGNLPSQPARSSDTQLTDFNALTCLDNEPWTLEEQLPCIFPLEDESDMLSEHFSKLKGSVSFEITDLTLREEDTCDLDPSLDNPRRCVKFLDPLVSHVWERPRTTEEEKDALFYSFEDTQMFRLEYFYEIEEDWDDLVFLDACDAVGTLAKKTYDLLLYVPDALYNTSCHY